MDVNIFDKPRFSCTHGVMNTFVLFIVSVMAMMYSSFAFISGVRSTIPALTGVLSY